MFYFSLIPAPWFCFDFVPLEAMAGLSFLLAARIFRPLPFWITAPTCSLLAYFIFQEYGRRLVPESAVTFLNVMLAAKFCDKATGFRPSLILGLLWVGSFALFNNTIYYIAYLGLFLALIFNLLSKEPQEKFSFKSALPQRADWLNLLKFSPLALALFFFFPRFHGFLPSANSASKGEVGYSKTVNNSNVSNLNLSSKVAFYAQTNKKLSPNKLYWRGRVHVLTDGYNWRPGRVPSERTLPVADSPSIEYEMKYEQDFEGDLVLLDYPMRIIDSSLRFYQDQAFNTFQTYRRDKKSILKAVSNPEARLRSSIERNKREYLQLPQFLPQDFKKAMEQIQGKKPEEVIQSFKRFLVKNNFVYTLQPGPLPSLALFLENKRGYCTHYASLLGLALRSVNIPARLVTGFQGGEFNEVGGYYTVRSNDAHAWVEYFHQGFWRRVDPTGFISPGRIVEGGENFLNKQNSRWGAVFFAFSGLGQAKQYLSNLNYKISLFLDDFDRQKQKDLAGKLKLELKSFYLLGLLALVFVTLAAWLLLRGKTSSPRQKEDLLFMKFQRKLSKKNILVEPSMSERKIAALCAEKGLSEAYLDFLRVYERVKYQEKRELLTQLRKLLKDL